MANPETVRSRKGPGLLERCRRYRGLLVLVVWQVPVQPVIRPNGSLGLMIGTGTDEHAELSCDGDLLRADRVPYKVAAVEGDYSLNEIVRVDAAGGFMTSDWESHQGAFGTVRLRGDWKSFGVGAGLALAPGFEEYEGESSRAAWPSLYLRAGSAETVHLRLETFPPNAFSPQQVARIGIGYNAVRRDLASGFIGLAGVGSHEGGTGVSADLSVPVADRFALRFSAHYADGERHAITGFAAGGRVLLGSAPTLAAAAR
ncbi:MAG TPA: hypothetical protein VK912_15335 [Longimicrobiales bacterium]|nr:hypothetical protein [Longimicrobiales bacterium]